jgi:PERQ amino acid-rich with GYF domain-containing protein
MLTWATRSRRDGRSANGTLTLRRSSTTPLSQSSQTPAPVDNAVQPPSAEPSAVELSPARYSKEDLLDMYRPQRISEDPSRLFMQGWNPGHVNGGAVRAWGKSNENHVPQEPGACWDVNGESTPMGHQGLTSDEKEVCPSPPPISQVGYESSPLVRHL